MKGYSFKVYKEKDRKTTKLATAIFFIAYVFNYNNELSKYEGLYLVSNFLNK
jgi:hypothetical protein